MSNKLVIVESPAKAKTLKKYLGRGWDVLACYGHVRDLPSKSGAVDVKADFAMNYVPIERNKKHVDAIEKALKKADALYLAADPDREGEAICWHLQELLMSRGALKNKAVHRATFNQITPAAVKEAVANPRALSLSLIDAQQTRRCLDYLVGFELSPVLWKKVRRGLSAGRVQSPALRLIAEREAEITAFKTQEYWSITAKTQKADQVFTAKLEVYQDEKLSQFSIVDAQRAEAVTQHLEAVSEGVLHVKSLEKKQRKRHPAAPFITSTLQQDAARKLGFSPSRTMRIAQQLYEGVDIGEGSVGLITYMRTDSVQLAKEAIEDVRDLIKAHYGEDQRPAAPRQYKTKSKNAQEAHEAIRPTQITRTPDQLAAALTVEQQKLYRLIWQRTVASQMISATINMANARLLCGKDNVFVARGAMIADPGFMRVYQVAKEEGSKPASEAEQTALPPLKEGETLPLAALLPKQHFTEPPPRYSQASLIKVLEERGIGRPSTYASINATLVEREYVKLEKSRFFLTDLGQVVSRFLTEHFSHYVDYDFTARMENKLDEIAQGTAERVPLMHSFWSSFKERVDFVGDNVKREEVTQEALDENCPECDKPLSIRLGRGGRFIGCTGYPDCRFTRNMGEEGEAPQKKDEPVEGRVCPTCASPLIYKHGRYGKFIGCQAYPKCKHIEPLVKPEKTGVSCPGCREGELLKRRSRRGTFFYSCHRYPTCRYAVWSAPVAESCPKCHWPILTIKTTKRRGTEKVCPQKSCDFSETMDAQ